MEFTITLDIENCGNCPFRDYIMEQGACGYICDATTRMYAFTDNQTIPEWCPLKEENKEKRRIKGIKLP